VVKEFTPPKVAEIEAEYEEQKKDWCRKHDRECQKCQSILCKWNSDYEFYNKPVIN
jgi:hypothetical protein